MSAVQKGAGVVWSVGAITYAGSITAVAAGEDPLTQSIAHTRTSNKVDFKTTGGTIVGCVLSNLKKTLKISVIPASTTATPTIAEAQSLADKLMPQAGTTVTITDDLGTTIDGDYNCIAATQNRTVDGIVIIEMELEGSDEGIDITTAVS
jgi:hypothetical protein